MPQSQDRQFVNPYTFVPFPRGGIKRRRAPGHTFGADEAGRRYSGSFAVTWTVRTPVALPEGENWYSPRGRVVEIPGSSAKGAVRSVHETLFGGCPRVLTASHIPVYRQLMKKGMVDGWTLAVVTDASDDGVPRTVRLCDGDPVWINAVALRSAYGVEIPCTGDTLTLKADPSWYHKGLERYEYPGNGNSAIPRGALTHVARDRATWKPGQYVFLVTDVAARKKTKNQHDANRHPIAATIRGSSSSKKKQEVAGCFWAAGKLGKLTATFDSVGQALAATGFKRLSEGSRDGQKNEQVMRQNPTAEPDRFTSVEWWTLPRGKKVRRWDEDLTSSNRNDPIVSESDDGHLLPADPSHWHQIALRRRADSRLHRGDVIWVRCEPQEGTTQRRVVAVKLAAAWRETPADAGDLGGRVKPTPCHTSEELCLSCAVFGSIDPDGDGPDTGLQTSYRGHVRLGAIRGSGIEVTEAVQLAPLSSPRPGTGMFYLESRPIPLRTANDRGDSPNRWGSAIDTDPSNGQPRDARGRKYYWHSDPCAQVLALPATIPQSRRRARYEIASSGDGFQTTVRLVRAGQTLTQTVTFDGMDRLSLLTLLAAFDPARVLEPLGDGDQYAIHLGGGKPFGLGTVTAAISDLEVSSVAARYTGAKDPASDWRWSQEDRMDLATRTGDLAAVHKAAAVVLRRHGLGEHEPYVTYPITRPWGDYGKPGFTKSYEFFQANSGELLAQGSRPYVVLPRLGDVADGMNPTITSGQTNA